VKRLPSSIRIKYSFGENVVAIVERLDHNLNQENISADKICRKILANELSANEVNHMKRFYARMGRIEHETRVLTPPILTERDKQNLMCRYYLAEDLKSFEDGLDEWRQAVQKAHEAGGIDEDLVESSLKSLEVVRKVAKLYSGHWETKRKAEVARIAEDLQRVINELPNPIEKVEKVLRGHIGLEGVNYYIVDNKFPNCSARPWGGQRWIVGWSDPPEMATPEVIVQVISDEASHWILEDPFTEEKRYELAKRLRENLDKREEKLIAEYPDRRLLDGVDGASMVLMEGYGHLFIGFPWTQDKIPKELTPQRQRGMKGTLYAESYHFTRWFHDHWKDFLENPSMNAEDWARQCVDENITTFIEIARKFLKRGTIY